jgi:DNA-binding HxlR family transcriptional regulator
VVRELLLGPKRFTDLRTGIPDISPNVLGRRLRELETSAVLRRRSLPPPAASKVYELTPWGYDLEPIVLALGRWGARSPGLPRDGQLSTDAFALALKGDFDPSAADGVHGEFELDLCGAVISVRVADREITVALTAAAAPTIRFVADPDTMTALLWDGLQLKEATRRQLLELHGDETIAARFLAMFPPPRP